MELEGVESTCPRTTGHGAKVDAFGRAPPLEDFARGELHRLRGITDPEQNKSYAKTFSFASIQNCEGVTRANGWPVGLEHRPKEIVGFAARAARPKRSDSWHGLALEENAHKTWRPGEEVTLQRSTQIRSSDSTWEKIFS